MTAHDGPPVRPQLKIPCCACRMGMPTGSDCMYKSLIKKKKKKKNKNSNTTIIINYKNYQKIQLSRQQFTKNPKKLKRT